MAIFNSPQAQALAMRARATIIDRGLVRTTRLVAEEALKISREQMRKLVYAHPIPTTRSGKPKWIRTGLLYTNERLEYSEDGTSVRLINQTRYAEVRHEMGKPGRRKTNYPAHWRDEMRAQLRNVVSRTHHQLIQQAFADIASELTDLAGNSVEI